ncbi:Lrp/AsnC family transcriptional regulator [Halorubrum lipolyticum]|uniref:AsnC family transcriptional regulator n=1 Tax=Halorubrum lipolyticum DSM 21995 TaxID=1227482 RepID=M0NN58_9EURY|nr:winged helix-turn-helix transcriptional regulator [Halorubrum lipolyticum]EMA58080.1 AsnC family transcriptional regulator [Halorubrum lipolyticum DSM 21995]
MTHHLDEIDRQIIHALMSDARNTSAPMIADGMNVSAGTIRNRIERLEEAGVIRGYTAIVDFEQAGGRLTSVFMCTVPADERERLALAARSIPGVINVRVLMAGRRDLQVVAVGEETSDLREIARAISGLDIRIEDEELLQTELHTPYSGFRSDEARDPVVTDTVTLADGTAVVEVCVTDDAPIVGHSPSEARDEGMLSTDVVVTSIERDGSIIHPVDDTAIRPNDVVTVLPKEASDEDVLGAFLADDPTAPPTS